MLLLFAGVDTCCLLFLKLFLELVDLPVFLLDLLLLRLHQDLQLRLLILDNVEGLLQFLQLQALPR